MEHLLANILPFLFLIGFWVFMMRQMQGGLGNRVKSGRRRGLISGLDQVLIESEKRIAEPKGTVWARISLQGGQTVEGRIVWADPQFIKYEPDGAGNAVVLPKSSIVKLEMVPR